MRNIRGKLSIELILLSTFIILLSSGVLATYDWTQYGNGVTWLTQNQYGFTFTGSFPNNVYSVTTAQGTGDEYNVQPLVTNFNRSLLQGELQQYIIFQQGNFLQIYDKNLNLVQEINTPSPISFQLGMTDFAEDGISDDIAGIYNTSTTNYQYNVYHFDAGTSAFSLYSQENISVTAGTSVTGMRCNQDNCFFLLSKAGTNAELYIINSSTTLQNTIVGVNSSYTEPLGYADMNGDGITEYWTYSSSEVDIFQYSGNVILHKLIAGVSDMKVYQSDASSLWKTAVLTQVSASSSPIVTAYKVDGSVYWTNTATGMACSGCTIIKGSMSIADFDGDNYADVYLDGGYYLMSSSSKATYTIMKGNTGTILFSYQPTLINNIFSMGKLTTADMNGDGKYDFVSKIYDTPTHYFFVISSLNNTTPLLNSSIATGGSCVPADMDFNGKLDIVCSGASRTTIFYSNYTNQAPTISTITYSPSTSIAVGGSVTAIITANDVEADVILYSHSCFAGDTWTTPNSNPAQTCTYASIGVFNMSVGVTDGFHIPQANTYSQSIIVTDTGTICGNAVCESGETYSNCPADCPFQSQNTTQVSGGMAIPSKLVDVTNTEEGLLPTIYYGLIAFLSGTLYPFMIVVFGIFCALILFVLGSIVAKLIRKIGEH